MAGIIIISVIYRILFATAQAGCHAQQPPQPDTAYYLAQVRAFIQWYRPQLPADLVLEDSAAVHPFGADFDDCLADTVDFTREEREQIRLAVAHPLIQVWTSDLVPEARIIASDSIKVLFKSFNGWNNFHKKYGRQYNRFDAPIFLRNNTLCLFYSDYRCGGLCGYGSLTLYKKVGNIWARVRDFGSWVS